MLLAANLLATRSLPIEKQAGTVKNIWTAVKGLGPKALGLFRRGKGVAGAAEGAAGRAAGAAESAAGRAAGAAEGAAGRAAGAAEGAGTTFRMPDPRAGYEWTQTPVRQFGSGNRFWGKPSIEQFNRGLRPSWSWRAPVSTLKNIRIPGTARRYANDSSLARMAGKGMLYGGFPMLAADNVVNTPRRMEAAGQMGAAHAMHQLRQGDTWDRIRNGLGIAFGSPDMIRDALAKRPNGQAIADRFYDLEQYGADETPWLNGEGNPFTYKDYFNLLLGQPY